MNERLLLVLPLPAFSVDERIFIDEQACTGLDLWLDNFPFATLACPTYDCAIPPSTTKPLDSIDAKDRLTFISLPVAYTPQSFAAHFFRTQKTLATLIDNSDYLHFAIGGFFGDWGAVAAIVANRKRLPFAVWTDRVESNVMAFQAKSMSGLRTLYYSGNALCARYLERFVIRRSSIGLFNGMDCFNAYAPFCRSPHLVNNFNYGKGTHISGDQLSLRLAHNSDRPLRFVYVGRVHKDKGVYDWIEAVASATGEFEATWFGDGPELDKARQIVQSKGLGSKIHFFGPTSHEETLRQLKDFDGFVFCHKTQESPRCLIEALACGLPIIGYETAYSKELVSGNSGGLLSSLNDINALTHSIERLISSRPLLSQLSRQASEDGKRFTSEIIFRERSNLMKTIPVKGH